MPKRKDELNNQYRLPNKDDRLSFVQVNRLLSDFEYCMANFQQLVNKQGQVVPFVLNKPQQKLAKSFLPLIAKGQLSNRRKNIVVCKCRQMGGSTEIVALINYICAFVEGINNLNILHVFPVGDSGGKFYTNKVVPIITGIHPFIAPTIEKTFTSSTSKIITYHATQGQRRGNTYEIVSANASSIRGGTAHIAILDEVADYTKPYDLEAAISPAIPDDGFSMVMYLSTFSDKRSDYFLEKIKLARENPDDWELVFIPWYLMYPERKTGISVDSIELTDYDQKVIIPALKADGIPKNEWGDAIAWYHRKSLEVKKMQQEYPTTIEEVIQLSANEKYFKKEALENQQQYIRDGIRARIVTDVTSNKPSAIQTDASPVRLFRNPAIGRNYMLAVDPITAVSDDTDYFAATMMDLSNNEQVATIHGRGIPTEDWAVLSVELCRIYNRAIICPESNVGEGFKTKAWDMGYYNWYYVNHQAKKNRTPGIRTTVASKERMLDILSTLLNTGNIIIRDDTWLEELQTFERQVKKRSNGDHFVRLSAPKGQHDDTVASLFIYAGTLNQQQIAGRKVLSEPIVCW